ncbi:hypothetical protein NM208_g648 [Fusarium decemcellulare]|uniref:Uncharacterized protein n=2 Tax=Fusarium decemcellulare TaxID=57161 RepID=A0ACC1S6M7_9HYPO|nr:hypothetical protein NM208_g8082 [Fusarium decemcellulare]KAJ3549130.1 hypothetical protein NM208_g648 [Fusarium decemcellulare]
MSGPHVLLTGANGFVASHILSILIDRNYTITATVRSQQKAGDIIRTHPEWKDKVNFVIVTDFTTAKPFDHLTREMLKSAQDYGGAELKRFALLGSAVAVLNSFQDVTKEGKPYTEKDWNPVTAEQAIERKDGVLGYNVSKTRAEAAAWEFMKANKPTFDLVVINPDIITGPMMHPISGPKSINETNEFAIGSFIDGTHSKVEGVTFPFYHFVDVRDVARSHVDALTNPAAANQRVLLVSGLISPQLVVNAIREHFPALRDRVPEGTPSQLLPPGVNPTGWDMAVSLDILAKGTKEGKWEYKSLKTSVVDTVGSMIEHKLI